MNSLTFDVASQVLELIAPVIIVSLLLGAVVVILLIVSTIRRWRVQSAILDIQKDIADIKQYITTPSNNPQPTTSNQVSPNIKPDKPEAA